MTFFTERRLVYENVCVELDLLDKPFFESLNVDLNADVGAGPSTNPKQMNAIDRAVRAKCENLMVYAVYALQSPLLKRRLRMFGVWWPRPAVVVRLQ